MVLEGVDWIDLIHERDICWAVVNTLMNLHVRVSLTG